MATIPVYLTDDDGNEIEQTAGSGDFIIIGYVDQDLFVNASGLLYTTFFDVVQAATPEQKAEVLRGLRLAKGIRGDLRRFELSGTSENAYVKYNHSIFGGRYQSQYTALGAIAGTYLRRGGSSFTKELVEAALIAGAFASFPNTFPSLVLPGDVQLSVSAGGGSVEGHAWTITDGVTTFSPTVASPTVTLTEGTWTVSVDVTIDGTVVSVDSRTLEVSALAVAAGLTNSNPTPALGESTLLGLVIDDTDMPLLQDIDWSFNVQLAAGQRVELTEDVDYTVNSQSGKTINVTFLTAGAFEVTARVTDTSGTLVSTQTNLDVADYATTNAVTNHSILSQATADALVQGDTHMVIIGDSLSLPLRSDRWRGGMVNSFQPARWAGMQPANNDMSDLGGSAFNRNNEHDAHQLESSNFRLQRGNTGSDNVKVDGTKNSITYCDPRIGVRRTTAGSFLELEALTTSPSFGYDVTGRSGSWEDTIRGRLQSPADTFYRSSQVNSRALLYNLDSTITLTASAVDATSDQSITMNSEGYYLVEVERDATTGTDTKYNALDVSFDSIAVNDRFGWMDNFVYSPAVSGLSLSYLGDGGWNSSNHTGDTARVTENTSTRVDEYYNDEAVASHLDLVAWKNKSQTVLRDNVVILIEIQNNSANGEGHDGQMRKDLLTIKTRWENAADVVDPSGSLKAKLKFIVVSLPDLTAGTQQGRLATMMPDIVGLGGYSNVEFIDLHNAIKVAEGGIYADPADYTDTYSTPNATGGVVTPAPVASWYTLNANGTKIDNVHPTREGSNKQMEILWSVVKDAASDPAGFSFTINAPANGTTNDTYNYTLSGSLPADRLVTWSVDGSIVAYGDSYTLPSSAGTFVVSAQVDGVDGAQATATASAVTISVPNSAPVISSVSVAGSTPEAGDVFSLVVEASDVDGDALSYTVLNPEGDLTASAGPTTDASVTLGPIVATSAGISAVYNVTVTDGSLSDSADITIVPVAPNQNPVVSTWVAAGGPFTSGDSISLVYDVSDADGDSLEADVFVSVDGGSRSPVVSNLSVSGGGVIPFTTTQSGSHEFTIEIRDGNGGTAEQSTTVAVGTAGPSHQHEVFYQHAGGTNNTTNAAIVTPPGWTITDQPTGFTLMGITTGANTVRFNFSTQTRRDNFHTWITTTGQGRAIEWHISTGDVVRCEIDQLAGPSTSSTVWSNLRDGSAAWSLNGGAAGTYAGSGARNALRENGATTGSVRFFE